MPGKCHGFLCARTKVALVCNNERLTYAEIDTLANRLARALLANGVRRGDRVLLFLPKSVELVVSIFATLKVNAVFVPVNPSIKVDKPHYAQGIYRQKKAYQFISVDHVR
ncbi:MAG: AMP-binding protein [Anaerolineaceae bacterium]|nr:AMP-binding protein [Anaerolineaceae bacterium]